MTKISVISDIHLETGNSLASIMPDIIPDVFVLAGDIHNGTNAESFIEKLLEKAPVIYVAGNHEFYYKIFPTVYDDMKFMEERLNIRQDFKGLSHKLWVLNNNTIELLGIRFIGTTLWTDYDQGSPNTMFEAARCMRDHHVIKRPDGSRFLPEDAYKAFKEATAYIRESLSHPFAGNTIVITHHTPSFQSVSEEFEGNALNGAFHSNLEYIMEECHPEVWIHGHTHTAMDYNIGSTRIVCNPHGYPHESRVRTMGYDKNKIITI